MCYYDQLLVCRLGSVFDSVSVCFANTCSGVIVHIAILFSNQHVVCRYVILFSNQHLGCRYGSSALCAWKWQKLRFLRRTAGALGNLFTYRIPLGMVMYRVCSFVCIYCAWNSVHRNVCYVLFRLWLCLHFSVGSSHLVTNASLLLLIVPRTLCQ